MFTNYEDLVICEGYIQEEKPNKILFIQSYNKCWVMRSDIKDMKVFGRTNEGTIHVVITITEKLAADLQIVGIYE